VTRIALLALLAGCGFRITPGSNGDGGLVDDADPDGMTIDGDVTDGPVDAMVDGSLQPTCILAWLNHTISFQTPSELTTVNSTSYDRDPFVSADELTIWFSSGNAASQGGGDVFKATRANRTQPFGSPARDPDFSTSGGSESKLSITENRLYAVVGSNVGGGAGGTDIWETSRPNTTAAWAVLSRTHTMQLATSGSELDPFVTADGLRVYFAPTSPSPQRIVVAKRANVADPFISPTEVANINSASGEADPMLFANDRVIVFASDRPAQGGSGNLWYATRTNEDQPFGTPIELLGTSSSMDESDPHVSPDGCRIYFARNVGGGVDWQLFSASSPP